MKKATSAIQKTLNNARARLVDHEVKALTTTDPGWNLYHRNGQAAFAHIVREIERVYGLEPKRTTLAEALEKELEKL